VRFTARGSFVAFQPLPARSFTAGLLTVDVTRTNRSARAFLGRHAFSTRGARVRFRRIRDANGDGRIGFDDVRAGDTVTLSGRLTKANRRCVAAPRLRIRRVTVRRGR
jgi:hypothetical protein